jgi:hypothetical protein
MYSDLTIRFNYINPLVVYRSSDFNLRKSQNQSSKKRYCEQEAPTSSQILWRSKSQIRTITFSIPAVFHEAKAGKFWITILYNSNI